MDAFVPVAAESTTSRTTCMVASPPVPSPASLTPKFVFAACASAVLESPPTAVLFVRAFRMASMPAHVLALTTLLLFVLACARTRAPFAPCVFFGGGGTTPAAYVAHSRGDCPGSDEMPRMNAVRPEAVYTLSPGEKPSIRFVARGAFTMTDAESCDHEGGPEAPEAVKCVEEVKCAFILLTPRAADEMDLSCERDARKEGMPPGRLVA